MAGMSQAGCCCGVSPKGACSTCEPVVPVCCLQMEHLGWSVNAPLLIRPSVGVIPEEGDPCPLDMVATEICGFMEVHWTLPTYRLDYCLPRIVLSWKPIDGDCDRILLTLKMWYRARGTSEIFYGEVSIEDDRGWVARDIEFEDPVYPLLVAAYPETYPDDTYTIKIRTCPEGYTAFPESFSEVFFETVLQEEAPTDSGVWIDTPESDWWPWQIISGRSGGSCACSRDNCHTYPMVSWSLDLYTDTVYLCVTIREGRSVLTGAGGTRKVCTTVDLNNCEWSNEEFFVYMGPVTAPTTKQYRVRITPIGELDCPTVSDPGPPAPYCKKPTLCAMLSVDGGENHEYYTLVWSNDNQQYELGPSAVPGSKPYTIEITLVEDAGSLPDGSPAGSRAWVLTVIIKEIPSGDAVLEYTEVYVIDCTEQWTRISSLEVPIDPAETWELTIGTVCPDPPPPPECDPGCWPECVMCPERKTLYAVVSDAPDCCLSGAYALTWVGTGGGGAPTVGYYELSAPVGGPIDTCGQITFLRVYCVDSTHITVQLVYLRAEGTEISNLSSPATLSVICDESGHLESDAINVPGRSGGRESLCGFGSDVGGDIRIVST